MQGYAIAYLADHPEYIQTCAAWGYGHWGIQSAGRDLQEHIKTFKENAQKGAIPSALLVINETTGLPVAMGSLWEKDGGEWPDLTPWIASLYVHYRHRGKGIASALVARLEEEARQQGFTELYLKTGSAAPLYEKLGYTEIETIPSDTSIGVQTLFRKDLT